MQNRGHLFNKYIVEDNTELLQKTTLTIQKDLTAQWLAGDDLKIDQFKFMHKVMKIIYDSALRDMLLNEDDKVIENVLPSLAAYEALLVIKEILDTKDFERKKELEKLQRDGPLAVKPVEETPEATPEVTKQPTTSSPVKKGQSMVQVAPIDTRSEHEKEKDAEREEIKKYGVI